MKFVMTHDRKNFIFIKVLCHFLPLTRLEELRMNSITMICVTDISMSFQIKCTKAYMLTILLFFHWHMSIIFRQLVYSICIFSHLALVLNTTDNQKKEKTTTTFYSIHLTVSAIYTTSRFCGIPLIYKPSVNRNIDSSVLYLEL